MNPIEVGFLSVLPPIIAIVLALITKEVISSLFIGILSGAIIYAFSTGSGIIGSIEVIFSLMSKNIGENAYIIIFLAILGALVFVITKAGGSQAYGNWASHKINSRPWAQISTFILGVFIFIDDYFNCLTVGTVMKPITDKNKVSRAKLAYLIDATAAPICILAPVSSWAASVISYMDGTGVNGMTTFIKTIPYNLYAILTIIMLLIISLKGWDFGPMAKFENKAIATGNVLVSDNETMDQDIEQITPSDKGKVIDLIIPIVSLIIFSLLFMLYLGDFFKCNVSLIEAFGKTNASQAITFGAFISLIIAFVMFVPRKLLSFKEFIDGINQGVKSMVPAFVILTFAWTISGICRDLLSTGEYVGDLVSKSNMPVMFIPAIVFIVAAFLAFSMGTSWGTFGILIPIVIMVCQRIAPEITVIAISATLSGAVFGDHCSPISDTTILSSTGAGCNHMDHVTTQLPYAGLVAGVSFLGYIVAGITNSFIITISFSIISFVVALYLLHKYFSNSNVVKSEKLS